MYSYSKKSKEKLSTCHPDIRKVFEKAIRHSVIDVSVTFGARSTKEQIKMYAKGRTAPGKIITNCNGIDKLSKHQIKEDGYSYAIDIDVYCGDSKYTSAIKYNPLHLAYFAGVVDSVSKQMFDNGEIDHVFVWGGNWDRDGILTLDQKFMDLCHWEIKKL